MKRDFIPFYSSDRDFSDKNYKFKDWTEYGLYCSIRSTQLLNKLFKKEVKEYDEAIQICNATYVNRLDFMRLVECTNLAK